VTIARQKNPASTAVPCSSCAACMNTIASSKTRRMSTIGPRIGCLRPRSRVRLSRIKGGMLQDLPARRLNRAQKHQIEDALTGDRKHVDYP
jgi:hypothetical protein